MLFITATLTLCLLLARQRDESRKPLPLGKRFLHCSAQTFLSTGWHSYPSKGGLARDFLGKLICNFATCQWSDRFGDELYRTEET